MLTVDLNGSPVSFRSVVKKQTHFGMIRMLLLIWMMLMIDNLVPSSLWNMQRRRN